MAARKPTPAIEPWNRQGEDDASTYGVPRVWILVTETEFQALRDGVVGSALRVRLTQSRVGDEPLAEAIPADVRTNRGGLEI